MGGGFNIGQFTRNYIDFTRGDNDEPLTYFSLNPSKLATYSYFQKEVLPGLLSWAQQNTIRVHYTNEDKDEIKCFSLPQWGRFGKWINARMYFHIYKVHNTNCGCTERQWSQNNGNCGHYGDEEKCIENTIAKEEG